MPQGGKWFKEWASNHVQQWEPLWGDLTLCRHKQIGSKAAFANNPMGTQPFPFVFLWYGVSTMFAADMCRAWNEPRLNILVATVFVTRQLPIRHHGQLTLMQHRHELRYSTVILMSPLLYCIHLNAVLASHTNGYKGFQIKYLRVKCKNSKN